jgi:hypothetical protein
MQDRDLNNSLRHPNQTQPVPPVYLPFTYVPYPSLNQPPINPPPILQQPQPRQIFLDLPQGNHSMVAPQNIQADEALRRAKKWHRVVFVVSLLLIVLSVVNYSSWVSFTLSVASLPTSDSNSSTTSPKYCQSYHLS